MLHDLGERVRHSRSRARSGRGIARLRATGPVAALAALALTASGCGGTGAKATDDPTTSASVSTTPTPTTTPTSTPTTTPTAAPLSPFEDKAPVEALRSWAAAATRDVNERHRDFSLARRFQVESAKVRSDVSTSWHEDFDKYFPGPLPFTPIAVAGGGSRATITVCAVASGFSLTRQGGKPAEKRTVIPVVFTMARQRGTWLLAGIVAGTADCSGVKIKEVPW